MHHVGLAPDVGIVFIQFTNVKFVHLRELCHVITLKWYYGLSLSNTVVCMNRSSSQSWTDNCIPPTDT